MIIRRLLPLALVLAWSAAPALAQGVKVAGADAPPKTDAPKEDVPKKEEAKPKKKAAKGKKKDVKESKYKSRALAESTESSYRFDESANPVGGAKKKSSSAEKAAKKKSSDDGDEKKSGKCSSEEPCTDKPTESDAL